MFGALAALNPVGMIGSALAVGESALAYKGQKDANESNEQIAKDNRAFQERMVNQAQDFEKEMSSSAYQRAMTDMKKSGLNPILAYKQGGASTPIGKTAPGATAVMQNEFGGMQGSPISGMATAQNIVQSRAQVNKIGQEIDNLGAQLGLTRQQTTKMKQETENLKSTMDMIDAQTAGIEADNAKKQALAEFIRKNPNAAIVSEYGGQGIVPLTTILGALGLNDLKNFAMSLIEKMKQNAPSFDFQINTPKAPNSLTDRY